MSAWAIIRNIGTIIELFRAVSKLIGSVAKTKAMPANYQIREVLAHVRKLLDNGAIDIPGVDEREVSDALRQIQDQLCKDGKCEVA